MFLVVFGCFWLFWLFLVVFCCFLLFWVFLVVFGCFWLFLGVFGYFRVVTLKGDSRVSQWCFKEVSRKFLRALRNFHECF